MMMAIQVISFISLIWFSGSIGFVANSNGDGILRCFIGFASSLAIFLLTTPLAAMLLPTALLNIGAKSCG